MFWTVVESATKTAASAVGQLATVVEIENQSSRRLVFRHDWYNHGYVEESGWPKVIANGETVVVRSYQRMFSVMGVSGTVTYEVEGTGTPLTFAFSCPSLGGNKLNAGTGGQRVWDEMTSGGYEPFAVVVKTGGPTLNVALQASYGTANACKVKVYKASQ